MTYQLPDLGVDHLVKVERISFLDTDRTGRAMLHCSARETSGSLWVTPSPSRLHLD
jgi:hypothetical protein